MTIMAASEDRRTHSRRLKFNRSRKFSARAFYLTIALVAVITVLSFLPRVSQAPSGPSASIQKRRTPAQDENQEVSVLDCVWSVDTDQGHSVV